jgi:hypothetical protein
MLPDLERAERIGDFWGHPATHTFGQMTEWTPIRSMRH